MFSYLQEKFKEAVDALSTPSSGPGSQFIGNNRDICYRDMESERERLEVARRQMRSHMTAQEQNTQRNAQTASTHQATVRASTPTTTRRTNR